MAKSRYIDFVRSLISTLKVSDSDYFYVAGATGSRKIRGSDVTPLNTVYVDSSLSTLPPAVGGKRQLENKRYLFVEDVTDNNDWELPNLARIKFEGNTNGTVVNLNGSIINAPGAKHLRLMFENLDIIGPGPDAVGSKLMQLTGVGLSAFPAVSPAALITIKDCVFWEYETTLDVTDSGVELKSGNIVNSVFPTILNNSFLEATISFWGNDPTETFPQSNLITINEGGSFAQNVTLNSCAFLGRNTDFGMFIDPTYTGQVVSTNSVNVSGSIQLFNPAGLNQKSDLIRVSGGLGFPSSREFAEANLTTSTTVPIATAGVFENVAGTFWVEGAATERFQVQSDGSILYTSATPELFKIDGTVTMSKAVGGSSDLLTACFKKNADTLTSGCGETDSVTPKTVPVFGVVELAQGDIIRLVVANQSSTTDIVVSRAKVMVYKI